jgi:hypothetical protein
VLDGGGMVLEGEVLEGDPVVLGEPVLEPAEDPSADGADPAVPVPVAPVVPFRVVLEPLVPMSPVLLPLVLEPMLPGCEPVWLPDSEPIEPVDEPVPVPALPAAPVPAPLPDVWAKANVASESVATIRSLRILWLFSLNYFVVGRISRPIQNKWRACCDVHPPPGVGRYPAGALEFESRS